MIDKIHSFFQLWYDSEKRIFWLDLVRFIAIGLVLLAHTKNIFTASHTWITESVGFKIWGFGMLGVEIFFVLSWFLIGGILIKQIVKHNGLDKKNLFTFWKRRRYRTLPNYYLFLCLNVILRIFVIWKYNFDISYFFFLQNFAQWGIDFFEVSWSLTIEEFFYLSLPIYLIVWLWIWGKKHMSRSILRSIISFITSIMIIRYIWYIWWELQDRNESLRKVVIYRLDSLWIWVLLSYFSFYYYEHIKKRKNTYMYIWWLLFCLLIAYYLIYILNWPADTLFDNIFFLPSLSISIACILPYFAHFDIIWKYSIIQKIITQTSIISYSIYLLHSSLILDPLLLYTTPQWLLYKISLSIVFIWIVYIISLFTYLYFEVPTLQLRDK